MSEPCGMWVNKPGKLHDLEVVMRVCRNPAERFFKGASGMRPWCSSCLSAHARFLPQWTEVSYEEFLVWKVLES